MINKIANEIHKKGWGEENWLVNNEFFCAKELIFYKAGSKCSLHFHKLKKEYFKCIGGAFKIIGIDMLNGAKYLLNLNVNEGVMIENFEPHQMIALEDNSIILEVSTQHFEQDSFRLEPGDSQLSDNYIYDGQR